MYIFNLVFLKLLSGILVVFLGYLAGKFQKLHKDSISSLLFYFIAPVVMFYILTQTKLKASDFSVILVSFALCTTSSILGFFLSGKIWHDNHRYILAMSAGTGNASFVALPIATAIFTPHSLSIYVLIIIGNIIYENSIGYYLCSSSLHSPQNAPQNFVRIIKLPVVISIILGSMMNLAGFKIPSFFSEFAHNIQTTFFVLGMILVGIALSEIKYFQIDAKFLSAIFIFKFLLFPLLFNVFVVLDRFFFKCYDKSYHDAFQLMSVTPVSVGVIIMSVIFNLYPEKCASSIMLSLLFALLYMPLMLKFML